VHLTIKGKVTYTPTFGWGTGGVAINEMTVLPKTTRYLEADLKDPPFMGSYEANAEIRYGPALDVFDTTKTKKGSFQVYPLSLLLILLLLIALAVGLGRIYRGKRYKGSHRHKGSHRKKKQGLFSRRRAPAPEDVTEEPAAPDEPAQPEEPQGLPTV
jgi:hypothetical protein